MSGRVLAFSKSSPAPISLDISMFRAFPGAAVSEPQRMNSKTEMESRVSPVGLGCVRGVVFAVAFEAIAAMVIYAGWQLIHTLH